MRIALSILGTEVFAVELGAAAEYADEYVDCGTTGSTVVGFGLPTTPQDFEPRQYDATGDEDA